MQVSKIRAKLKMKKLFYTFVCVCKFFQRYEKFYWIDPQYLHLFYDVITRGLTKTYLEARNGCDKVLWFILKHYKIYYLLDW